MHASLPRQEKSAAILEELESKSGDIDILPKHLSLEQAINADSPLILSNKLVLLQDGPATDQTIFAAIHQARDHINLETDIFGDEDIGRQFADSLLEKQVLEFRSTMIYSMGQIQLTHRYSYLDGKSPRRPSSRFQTTAARRLPDRRKSVLNLTAR